jgi:predicted molibdopterin-dependent oxidoreductase YjgC
MVHPDDAAELGIAEGDEVVLAERRGHVRIAATLFPGVGRGVLVAESVWPNAAFADGRGINTLTGTDQVAPLAGPPSTTTGFRCGKLDAATVPDRVDSRENHQEFGMRMRVSAAALLCSLAVTSAALAGASSGPFPNPEPDPADPENDAV